MAEQKRTKGTGTEKLSQQVEKKVNKKEQQETKNKTDFSNVISTGSTLLNLAISGGIVRGGGIPNGGWLIEIFGPASIGKTSMLCEIAGDVKRKGGETQFHDPEARFSTTFAQIFDLELKEDEIKYPDTPDDVFNAVWQWSPKDTNKINAVLIDSTAALASDLEMQDKKDEYQRRARLFSQGFRKVARRLKQNNCLMVCSNQIREKMNATPFGEKTDTPGGQAMKFYSSLRLKVSKQQQHKLKREITVRGRKERKTFGVAVQVEVFKSSIWEPFNTAPVYIDFQYGIDDIRANLEYIKKWTDKNIYYVDNNKLSNSLEKSIELVEENELEDELSRQVIDIWEEIQQQFKTQRKKKKR